MLILLAKFHARDSGIQKLTGEDSAGLLGVEVVVGAEDQWDGAELQVESGPAERYPKREEEDDWFGKEHVLGTVSEGIEMCMGVRNIRNGR